MKKMGLRQQTLEELAAWQIRAVEFLEELRAEAKKGPVTNWKLKIRGRCLDLVENIVVEDPPASTVR